MNKSKELLIWKFAAVSLVLVYLYKVSKANGMTLMQSPMGSRINPDHISKMASHLVPEEWRPKAQQVGTALINKFLNE